MPDNSFEDQLRQSRHAATLKAERATMDATGLSRSQVRRLGSTLQDDLRVFAERAPEPKRNTDEPTKPKIGVKEQKFNKTGGEVNGPGTIAHRGAQGGSGITLIAANDNGERVIIAVSTP